MTPPFEVMREEWLASLSQSDLHCLARLVATLVEQDGAFTDQDSPRLHGLMLSRSEARLLNDFRGKALT